MIVQPVHIVFSKKKKETTRLARLRKPVSAARCYFLSRENEKLSHKNEHFLVKTIFFVVKMKIFIVKTNYICR